jgi:hypothetical protein
VTPLGKRDLAVGAALFACVFAVTLWASRAQGVNRDEAYYMQAGEMYAAYVERAASGQLPRPFSDGSIQAYFGYNHEHPPLMKLLYGLSWRLLHRCDCAAEAAWHPPVSRLSHGQHVTLGLLREITAFRVPTIFFFALLCALVYLFVVDATYSRAGALGAALFMAAQPRAFFHAQTAGFDLPAATLWFATLYAYWRSLDSTRPWRAALVVGLLYGLFLATKLQSFFLPIALGSHWIVLGILRKRQRLPWPTIKPLCAMATLSPLVFLGLWPWLWHDTWRRFGAYLRFHWEHVHYNFEYFGQNYNQPPYPWHEPLGMLVTTAPVVLLVLAAAGTCVLARAAVLGWKRKEEGDPRATATLLTLWALVPVVVFFGGTTPIFGETKHWLATMPVLAVLAGVALAALWQGAIAELGLTDRPRLRALALAALLVVAVSPAAVETVRSHPYGLSHYNALAGGAPGGADLGMNRQFWGYSVRGLLGFLNRHLPSGSRLYLHDWNHDAYVLYLRDGLLGPGIADAGMEDPGIRASSAALVIHEKHFNKYEYMIWDAYQHARPAEVLTLDGVPLVTLYLREPPP